MPLRASPPYTCQMYAYLIVVFFSTDKDKSLIFNLELQILLSERNRHDCTHLWLTIEKWNGPQLNDDSRLWEQVARSQTCFVAEYLKFMIDSVS